MCSCFLPSFTKDSHDLCYKWCGQVCDVDLRCGHCEKWSLDKWSLVQAHHVKL